MNNTELTMSLCAIIDQQNAIIQAQAMELAQFDALTRAGEINTLRKKYAEAIGGPVEKLEV